MPWSSDGDVVVVSERIVQAAAVTHQFLPSLFTGEHHQHVYGTFEHNQN